MDANLTDSSPAISPSCFERLQIESRLRSSNAALAELDEQILKVRFILRELESQRDGTSILRTSLHAVLSPLRRFPAEILAEIFLFCRNNSLGRETHSTIDPRQAPLLLGQICSHWRAVSQNPSHLWDQIHIQGTIPPMRDTLGVMSSMTLK
ncbi:hypothetical protein C8J57DRAFT_1599407 [Mycena rebaudengoi]|nr:hypothetical protein C8J57DRAFT_1599407 [Mycena rebaudengoi]